MKIFIELTCSIDNEKMLIPVDKIVDIRCADGGKSSVYVDMGVDDDGNLIGVEPSESYEEIKTKLRECEAKIK